MKCYNKSKFGGNPGNMPYQMKKSFMFFSLLKSLKLCYKYEKINVIKNLLSMITLIFIFWQSLYLCDMKDSIKYSLDKRRIHEENTGRLFERILRTDNSNIFERCGNLFRQENGESTNFGNVINPQLNIGTLDTNEETYENQLRELTDRISEAWTSTYRNMLVKYIVMREKSNMNSEWSQEMWYERWHRYLFSIWDKINTIITNDTYDIGMKEYYSYLHLNQVRNDFRLFLDIVKSEWNRRNEAQLVDALV
ncbi:Plasmodium exported protein, unknown function [Plasmodium ovale curtisi]|uniref:Uncharacterized protein n=1 Tax=Plasmodium ovale curtisi TaxID=864141 RepID=A0A1A8XCK7_PLAOA|nr:Plasmodium exported protein, unknown function [Plasmodium ovale curtisi]